MLKIQMFGTFNINEWEIIKNFIEQELENITDNTVIDYETFEINVFFTTNSVRLTATKY